ncbi:MAG: SH3 domain-containing protein [Synergistaceae bacterium]|nr:SH3 domain-containing protein [Synergistaceae bacterium]
MRWIILALSLGATIVSLIHGVLATWQLASSGGSITVGGSAFTWMTAILLLASVITALIGGIMAFNRRKIGGIFILAAALICLFAHSSTRVYGWIYLVGGALAFMIRSSSEYYEDGYIFDDADEYGAEEYDEDEEEKRERNIFAARPRGGKREREREREEHREFSYGAKRQERASRIKLDGEEHSLSGEPFRLRSSKVCPACGASVGVEHKFCYICGSSLHAPQVTDAEPAGPDADIPLVQGAPSAFKEFQMVSPLSKYDEEPEEEDFHDVRDEVPEKAEPHRVFVKPPKEDETEFHKEFKNPFTVDPDNSYQEFSNYTRRRKRKRNSLTRRIVGPLVLLLAVSGAAWILLSVRRVPPPPPQQPVAQQPEVPLTPVVVPPPPTIWERLRIEAPNRGIVTGTNVNVRQSHSTAAQIVTRLNSGVRTDVIGQWTGTSGALSGTWFNIRSEGREGWIFGQFFQPLDGRQATLPSGYTDALLKSFGSDRTELIEHLGSPTRQTPAVMTWNGISLDFRGANDIIRMQVTGARHVLQNELAVGMDEDVLYRRIGYPSDFRSNLLRYVEIDSGNPVRGVAVRLQNGKVQSITVGNL